jgi:hypothetical protein
MSTAIAKAPDKTNGKPKAVAVQGAKIPIPPEVAAAATPDFTKIKKTGVHELLKVAEIHVFKRLQARENTDAGSVVDEARCQQFAAAMLAIDKDPKLPKFPPVKVMRVTDAPGFQRTEVDVCWDGMHTLRAKEIAKQPEVDALLWHGTFAEAQFLAATRANREHEKNGAPLTNKGKIHSVEMFVRAHKEAGIPKKDWPSNRETAETVGCSRQLVNEMDPWERGSGDKRELTAAKKRGQRNGGGEKPVREFEIVDATAGGAVVDTVSAARHEDALKAHKEKFPEADPTRFVAREVAAAATPSANGSARPVGFDWSGMDAHLGYLIRGWEGLGDVFGLKGTPEHTDGIARLNSMALALKTMRQKFGKKTGSSGNPA